MKAHFITTRGKGNPASKLADAELHFDDAAADGLLYGLKLIGFAIWERRGGTAGAINVTFPARQYSVNGERRSFALLRPLSADRTAESAERIRAFLVDAYVDQADKAEDEGAVVA